MKRYGRSITFAFCLAVMAIPGVSFAAGSGHFVIISQGVRNEVNATPSGTYVAEYVTEVGTGWVGSTTGAFLAGDAVISGSGTPSETDISIQGYTDATYNTNVSFCGFYSDGTAQTSGITPYYLQTVSNPGDCILKANLFYRVVTDFVPVGSASGHNVKYTDYFGAATTTRAGWSTVYTGTGGSTPGSVGIAYFAIVGSGFQLTTPSQYTCGLLDPLSYTGCIQNALIATFFPSSGAFDSFANLGDLITSKAPFGYLAQTFTAIQGFNDATSSTFTLAADSTINTNIFTPLRTALAVILWAVFALWFFTYVRGLQIV